MWLDVHVAVAEGRGRLGGGGGEGGGDRIAAADDLHAPPAATRRGLEDDRVADAVRLGLCLRRTPEHACRAREQRQPRLPRRLTGPHLVSHQAQHLGPWADEANLAVLADLGEVGVLREEAIPGVDGVGACDLRRGEDRRDVEVALARGRRTDAHRLVGEAHVERGGVGGGVHGDGGDPQLAASADDPEGDLPAVGDEDLLEHAAGRPQAGSIRNSGWPNSTGCPFSTKISVTFPGSSASISFISFIASMMQRV